VPEAREFLAKHHCISLATNGPAGLWASTVFYANEGFDLYFLSGAGTRHAWNCRPPTCNVMATDDSSSVLGLTESEVLLRRRRDGPNELVSSKRHALLADGIAIVREPMSLLLIACGVLYMVLGDVQESLMFLGFVIFIMGITLYQERKTTRALDAVSLRSRSVAVRESSTRAP